MSFSIGVLNGTLEARRRENWRSALGFSGREVQAKQRLGAYRRSKFNAPFLYHSNWREAPLAANDKQIAIGGIYSSPIVVNGVVYFGSADGFLYALE